MEASVMRKQLLLSVAAAAALSVTLGGFTASLAQTNLTSVQKQNPKNTVKNVAAPKVNRVAPRVTPNFTRVTPTNVGPRVVTPTGPAPGTTRVATPGGPTGPRGGG